MKLKNLLFTKELNKMATLINSDMVVMFDCDDTCVMWNNNEYWLDGDEKIELVDPYDNATVYLYPHTQHINLMKKYKKQGYTIVLWSAAGHLWAKEVADKLKINDLVDIIMSKPIKYVDDISTGILGSRVYIPYKHTNRIIEPGEPE